MTEEKIIIAGFGGQGVLSLGQFVAYAAMAEDKYVTWLPSYGPEMRGGTANCSVVVSDEPIASPVIAKPDCLIAFNKPSLSKFADKVRPGGLIIVNSSLVHEKVARDDIEVIYLPANELAHEAGNDKTLNIVILGAYIALRKIVKKETVLKTIENIFGKKPKIIPVNIKAFDLGYNKIV